MATIYHFTQMPKGWKKFLEGDTLVQPFGQKFRLDAKCFGSMIESLHHKTLFQCFSQRPWHFSLSTSFPRFLCLPSAF